MGDAVSGEMAIFIFRLIDVNSDGHVTTLASFYCGYFLCWRLTGCALQVDLEEFTQLIFLFRSLDMIEQDALLAHKVVVARSILLVEEDELMLEVTVGKAPASQTKRKELLQSYEEHLHLQQQAEGALEVYYDRLMDSLSVTGRFTLKPVLSILNFGNSVLS